MDMELDELFQWQTPLCTLLEDIGGIEEDGIDSMLQQIELPDLQDDFIPGAVAVDTIARNPSSSTISSNTEPVSSPLWPCDLQTSALNDNGILRLPPVQLSLDSVGSPQSSTAPLTGAARDSQGSKREVPLTPAAAKPKRTRAPRATKSTPKAKKPCQDPAVLAEQATEKENRLPTQAEHIIRERQRRDDMASKYLILESLLPPAPKRERAVVVESAMLFVKDLQQKRSDLLKRRAQLKLMVPGQSPAQQVKTAPRHDSSGCMKLPENCRTDSPISSATPQELITSPGTTNPVSAVVDYPTSGIVQQLHVHVHFSDDEIVIEMVCHQPRDNFHSFLLQAVESFGLDIVRCSIYRVPHGFLQCTITCNKSRVMNASPSPSDIRTSETLIGALKDALARS